MSGSKDGYISQTQQRTTAVTHVVDSSNEEEDLQPSERRNRVDGRHTIGDIGKLEARCDLTREAVELGDDVSDHRQHGDTAVLDFGGTVLIKGGLVFATRQTSRVEVTGRCNHTRLGFIRHHELGGSAMAAWYSESSGRAGKKESGKKLHGNLS